MKSKLTEYTEEQQDLDDASEHNAQVLLALRNYAASFISEIAWDAGLTEYQAKVCLNSLCRGELVERIPVSNHDPDPRLLSRVADMSAKNQAGYENFSRRSWFGLTEQGLRVMAKDKWKTG